MYNPPPNPENQPNQPPYGTSPGQPGQPYGTTPPPGYGAPNQPPYGYGVPNQQPPGYMPPPPGYGYGPPPVPQRRGMPGWAWVIIIGVVLAVFSCIGLVAFGVGLGLNAVGEGQKVYQGFLENAANGRVERAYATLAPSLRNQINQEQFKTAFVDKASEFASLESLDSNNFNASTVNGRSTLYFSGVAKFRERSNAPFHVSLIKSGESWLIEGFSIDEYTFGTFTNR